MPLTCTITEDGFVETARTAEEARCTAELQIKVARAYSGLEGNVQTARIEGIRVGIDRRRLPVTVSLNHGTLYRYSMLDENGKPGESSTLFVGRKKRAVLRKRRGCIQRLLHAGGGGHIYELLLPAKPEYGEVTVQYDDRLGVALPTGNIERLNGQYGISFFLDPPKGYDVTICFQGMLADMISNGRIPLAEAQ